MAPIRPKRPKGRPQKAFNITFRPRPFQETLLAELDKYRYYVNVCHRRAGKTYALCYYMTKMARDSHKDDFRACLIAPYYQQAKDVAWDFLNRFVERADDKDVKIKNSDPVRIKFRHNNAIIKLYGAENLNAIRGTGWDLVIFDEFAFMDKRIWTQVIQPAIEERDGQVIFNSTPRGKDDFYQMLQYAKSGQDPEWGWSMFRLSETGLLSEKKIHYLQSTMDEADFETEYECSFEAPIRGSYYGKMLRDMEKAGRCGEVLWSPDRPVYTAWDVGVDDTTAIWFFQKMPGGRINVIDYFEDSNEGILHYLNLLKSKGYFYARHYGPHDLKNREMSTGKSVLEIARDMSVNFDIVPRLTVQDGIQAVRIVMPRCYFNTANDSVSEGFEYLKRYAKDYNYKLRTFKNKPRHDECSNAADAFRMFCVVYRDDEVASNIVVNPHKFGMGKSIGKSLPLPLKPAPNSFINSIIEPQQQLRHGGYTPPNIIIGPLAGRRR